jgi:hypothetical protein
MPSGMNSFTKVASQRRLNSTRSMLFRDAMDGSSRHPDQTSHFRLRVSRLEQDFDFVAFPAFPASSSLRPPRFPSRGGRRLLFLPASTSSDRISGIRDARIFGTPTPSVGIGDITNACRSDFLCSVLLLSALMGEPVFLGIDVHWAV